uniref:Doublecortin domain-containing protein n=1 Tax=Pelodiscus sinensis TaxID=13735 RepID=K7FEP5_PELSI
MMQAPANYLPTSSPYNYEQALPSVTRINSIPQVPPTKKITFFKSGDPQFGGVKMAINPRSFKSFNALMDDLSHRVPLPFGVRTITTPRGVHCISALDQLEDGGCYLCSDKKYTKPFSIGMGRRGGPQWNGRPVSALRRGGPEGRHEDQSMPFSQQAPKIPKKITLVKNGDVGVRRSIILNRRNARSFKTLLDEISELLQFTVKKLYTVDGKKIDSMQALLHCPSVLVCVGREPFKPLVLENSRRQLSEKLPGLATQPSGNPVSENDGSKKDGGRVARDTPHMPLPSAPPLVWGYGAVEHPGERIKSAPGVLVNDDIEKRVHMNKDGSLSVEMKVRFRLLNDETLHWSTRIKKSNLMSNTPCEESGIDSEAEESLYPCDADSYISKLDESESEETHCHSCGKQHLDYDIWKNPMHASRKEEPNVRNTWHTRSSRSSTSSRRRIVRKKITSMDSLHTTSSEEYSEHIVQESSCYSETTDDRVECCNVKKHNYRSTLSTAASRGEESQDCSRRNTSSSQKASSVGPGSQSSCENNLDSEEAVDEAEASQAHSQNEDENDMEVSSVKCSKEEMDEIEGSRVGSRISRSSLHSRQKAASKARAWDGNIRRSDSDEILVCNASCSSKASRRTKHSQIHLDAHSEMSVSSRGSTAKKKKKNSLHAEVSRSNSKASNYSKSSYSPLSSTSSVNEAAPPPIHNEDQCTSSTSKCYSKSSKGTKQGSQSEASSKMSSPSSSVSNSNRNDGEGHAQVSSETPSSRHGSMSESLCSKCEQPKAAGNDYHPSSSSRVSSYSDLQGKRAETEVSRTSNDGCSQSSVTRSSKPRRKKMKSLHAGVENSSRASASEVASMGSLHCPTPPKGKPSRKKLRPAVFKNSSSISACTESVLTEGKEQKEILDSSKPTSSGSKSAEMNAMNGAENKSHDEQKEDVVSCKEKMDDPEDLAPSALPNTSPEEVVQEWLSKIPPETLLMKYEMEDDGAEQCTEATTEISHCARNQETSEEETAERQDAGEGENGAEEELEEEAAEAEATEEGAEKCTQEEKTSEGMLEGAEAKQAECSQSIETSSQNNHRKDLPSTIQTSVQIMKALLSSKQEAKFDRSNSLPEVSPTMGRKLSNSANILITCLASLQLLDEEPLGPSDKPKSLNKPRYTELLNIFQALWFGCTVEKSGPSSGQPGSDQIKMSSGFKGQKSTPMSSSGVDVGSGSGESREGSMASARDCILLPQKTVTSKLADQGASVENEPELSETGGQSKAGEQCSRPSTSCSKSKEGREAASIEEDSPEMGAEADHDEDDQGSNCENREGGENEVEENSKAEAGDEIPPEANTDEVTEQPSNLAETDAIADDANGEKEAKSNVEEAVGEGSPENQDSNVQAIPETSVKTSSIAQQKSVDPDPVWVLRFLKKIEKEFMTHYISAMNEFKIRWNLENNELLDKMISELKDEVSKRIQKSIEKELRKIKSRAGRRHPKPPNETLRRESTIQTEQRRQRLQTMLNRSLFNDRTVTQSKPQGTTDLSFDVGEEDFGISVALVDEVSEQPSEEEYCPCDACIRKKMASKPTRNPIVAANAPIVKAFDLKQILRGKEENETENNMVDCASEVVQDSEAIPSEHTQEAGEETNSEEADGEYEPEPPEQKPDAEEEKEPEQSETDEQGEQEVNEDETAAPAEGDEISDNQSCEVEEEAKEQEEEQEEEEEERAGKEEEEEEAKEEEEEQEQEEEEQAGKEEEEVKEEADETKEEEEEVKEEGGNEEEEVKQEEGNGEVEEEEKGEDDTPNENQECEQSPKSEEDTEGKVEGAEGEADRDNNEENASECEANAGVSDAAEDAEEAPLARNEEEPQADVGDEAVEETGPEVECEACSEAPAAEEEHENEGDPECAQNGDEAAGDEPQEDNEEAREARNGEVPEMASTVVEDQDCSKQSQKGSEDGSEGEEGEDGNPNDDPSREANADGGSKSAKMYPDIEEEDEEEEEDRA